MQVSPRLTIANTNATNAPVSLEALEQALLTTSDEFFLGSRITLLDPQAYIHPASRGLVRHDLVDLRVLLQNTVDHVCLLVRDLLLPANFLTAVQRNQALHHLAGNPDVEDRERVI